MATAFRPRARAASGDVVLRLVEAVRPVLAVLRIFLGAELVVVEVALRLTSGVLAGARGHVHALHLLQSCLVYVNTLMLQRVLAEPAWMARMTPADARGLTPLVWSHVSPYGAFDLDMEQRLDLDWKEVA